MRPKNNQWEPTFKLLSRDAYLDGVHSLPHNRLGIPYTSVS